MIFLLLPLLPPPLLLLLLLLLLLSLLLLLLLLSFLFLPSVEWFKREGKGKISKVPLTVEGAGYLSMLVGLIRIKV